MVKNKSYFVFFMLLIALSLVIAACSNTNNVSTEGEKDNKEAASEPAETKNKEIRIVKTINGDIEIPANPKRIVVESYLPTLLILGEEPVGATKVDVENVHIQDIINAGIESTGEGSMEKILELQPDLIISSDMDKSAFEKFSKIAPTIIIPYETYSDVHEEVRAIGGMLGKDKEAEKWLATFDEKIQQHREKVQAVMDEGETVSILGSFAKDSNIYGDGIYKGGQAIYKQLQLTPSKRIKEELIDKGESYKQVSFEVMTEYAGDYIFFDQSNGGKFDRNDPVWESVDAVKKDNVFYLDEKRFRAYDPIAVLAQAEEVADMLVAKKNSEK